MRRVGTRRLKSAVASQVRPCSCRSKCVCALQRGPRLGHAVRAARGGLAQPVGDDLLHGVLQMVVADAVPHAHVEPLVGIGRQQASGTRVAFGEVLDEDGRFGQDPALRHVVQHGKTCRRPQRLQGGMVARPRSTTRGVKAMPLSYSTINAFQQ